MTTVKKTGWPSRRDAVGATAVALTSSRTRQDLLEPLLPYFKAGLESRELCVWIIHKPLTEAAARRAHIQRAGTGRCTSRWRPACSSPSSSRSSSRSSGAADPVSDALPDLVECDRDLFWLEASVPGIVVAGDVRHGPVKRIAAGVGEGAMAVDFIHEYRRSNCHAGRPTS